MMKSAYANFKNNLELFFLIVSSIAYILYFVLLEATSNRLFENFHFTSDISSLLITLIFTFRLTFKNGSFANVRSFISSGTYPRYDKNELKDIRSKVPLATKMGYIITEEYLMAPFMDRSHIVEPWLSLQTIDYQNKTMESADFIVLTKNNKIISKITAMPEKFTKVIETNSLICFKPHQ